MNERTQYTRAANISQTETSAKPAFECLVCSTASVGWWKFWLSTAHCHSDWNYLFEPVGNFMEKCERIFDKNSKRTELFQHGWCKSLFLTHWKSFTTNRPISQNNEHTLTYIPDISIMTKLATVDKHMNFQKCFLKLNVTEVFWWMPSIRISDGLKLI